MCSNHPKSREGFLNIGENTFNNWSKHDSNIIQYIQINRPTIYEKSTNIDQKSTNIRFGGLFASNIDSRELLSGPGAPLVAQKAPTWILIEAQHDVRNYEISMKKRIQDEANLESLLDSDFSLISMDFWRKHDAKLTLKIDRIWRHQQYHEEQK